MIKVFDKLWYIQKRNREFIYNHETQTGSHGDVTIEKLSYMTYYENNAPFKSRSQTGLGWARSYETDLEVSDGIIIDNSPQSGFKVVGSVGRWSTQNKLFQIEDPRGFIVEIPTGNLSALLNDTTVINAVIQEDCVWGREASNHVLLSIGSDPYLKSLENMKALDTATKIKPKDLTIGDWVSTVGGGETYFAGRCRITWTNERSGQVVEDKWSWLFLEKYKWSDEEEYSISQPQTPKVTGVVKNEILDWVALYKTRYMPDRVSMEFHRGDGKSHEIPNPNYNISDSYYGWRKYKREDDEFTISVEYK